jgi:hypothetical protein
MNPFIFTGNKWINDPTLFYNALQHYPTNNTTHTSLTSVSYNIWFHGFAQELRYRSILGILQQSNADFICLQEVIHPFLMLMGQEKWIQENYIVTDALNENIPHAGQT